MARGKPEALRLIKAYQSSNVVNGWQILLDLGTYGTRYLHRAYGAWAGLGNNAPEDSIYPNTAIDAEGRPLDGAHRCVLRFDKPVPAKGFWSLTMYDLDGYLAGNPIKRYAIGDRDDLKIGTDDSIELYIQHDTPGADKESNWLPAPEG